MDGEVMMDWLTTEQRNIIECIMERMNLLDDINTSTEQKVSGALQREDCKNSMEFEKNILSTI